MTAVTDHPHINLSIILGVDSAQFFVFLSTTQFRLLYSHNMVMDKKCNIFCQYVNIMNAF